MKHSLVWLIIFPGHQLNNTLREGKKKKRQRCFSLLGCWKQRNVHDGCSNNRTLMQSDPVGTRTHLYKRIHLMLPRRQNGAFIEIIYPTRSYGDRPLKAKSEGTQESRMQLDRLLHLKILGINTIKGVPFSLAGESVSHL